jgi:hypothetical protein
MAATRFSIFFANIDVDVTFASDVSIRRSASRI